MASKRFPRGFRQFDNDSRLDSPTARGNAFGQPRVTLVVAAVIVFAAGALIGRCFVRLLRTPTHVIAYDYHA